MKSFWRSVRHAFRGIVYAIRNERNFQIECVAAVAVIFLACFFPLSSIERTLIVFLAGWVMAFELINTAIERMLDIIKPNVHPYVRVVKDMAAGAVLVSSGVAVVIGLCVFLPHLIG